MNNILPEFLRERLRVYATDANLLDPIKMELDFFQSIIGKGEYSKDEYVKMSSLLKSIIINHSDKDTRMRALEDLIFLIDNNYN